jgi:hypothetical protein
MEKLQRKMYCIDKNKNKKKYKLNLSYISVYKISDEASKLEK